MTNMLTFSVYSLRISGEIPTQNLPMITYYFLFSMVFNLLAFLWFGVENVLRSNHAIPGCLIVFANTFGRKPTQKFKSAVRRLSSIPIYRKNKTEVANNIIERSEEVKLAR